LFEEKSWKLRLLTLLFSSSLSSSTSSTSSSSWYLSWWRSLDYLAKE
jgi:hypothetical protein